MLGSIQSGRCHLGFGLALADWIGHRWTQGGGRSHRDWAIDSERPGIGGVHGFLFSSMRLLPDRGELSGHFSATDGFMVLLVERLVDFCRAPEVMEKNGQLAGHRDDGSLLGILAAARSDS
jgi:hypothetical protein